MMNNSCLRCKKFCGERRFCIDCQIELDVLLREVEAGFIADWNEDNV